MHPSPITVSDLAEINRPALIALARQHRLVPQLSGAVAAAGLSGHWPELQDAQRRTSIRALHQAAVTLRLLEALAAAGCRALVLKGQALSVQIYGRTDLRMSADVDLLIDPAMTATAHQVMIDSGFYPRFQVPIDTLSSVNKNQEYAAKTLCVELHWRLFDNQAFLPFSFEDLWEGREFVPLMQSRSVPTLPRIHHLLYQMLHGLRHGWQRCRWVVDLAIPLEAERDRQALFALAGDYRFTAPMLHTARLAQEYFSLCPKPPIAGTEKHARVEKIISRQIRILTKIHGSSGDEGALLLWGRRRFHEKLLDLALCPNPRAVLIEIKQCFISIGDLINTPLPKHLLWIYILLRPFLFLRRVLQRRR